MKNISVLLFLSVLTSAVHGQDALRQRFLTEAPIGWKKIRQQIEGNIRVDLPSGEVIDRGTKEATPPMQVRMMGKNELFTSLPMEGERQYLEAVNGEYSFTLHQDTADSGFVIDNISYDTQKCRTRHQWKHGHLQGSVLLFEGIMIEMAWLEDIFAAPDITITQISETIIDNHPVVEVVFSGGYQVDKHTVFSNGRVKFLPENDWTLLSYTGENRDVKSEPGTVRSTTAQTIEYQTFGSIPFPKLVKRSTQREDGSQYEYVQTFDTPDKIENNEIFYLKHYGFGEIDIKPVSHFRWIFTLIGVILIILGLVLYAFQRKR